MTGPARPTDESPAEASGGDRTARRPDGDAPHYDVFISYSQHLDRDVATVFQRGMENFGRPWYRPVRLRVFRDMTHLAASPDLQGDIERALARSRWLVVMASPLAAASPWVRAEIDWWVANKPGTRVLLAWTDGQLEWDREAQDFDWSRTDALPREQMRKLLAVAPGCPRWVDLRWLRAQIDERGSVPVNDPRLLADVAEFVAPVQGRSKADLIGHHLRLRRQRNRLVAATILVLTALLVTATALGLTADRQRDIATERQQAATSRQLVAEAASIQDARPDLARQLLVEAYRLSHTEQAVGALLGSGSLPRVLHTGPTSGALAFGPRGRLLAAADDGGVTLFDTATGRAVSTLDGPRRFTRSVAFAADGRMLAEGDNTGRIRLWDVSDATAPRLLGSARPVGDAQHVAFAGTAPLLVVGTGTQSVLLDVRAPDRPRITGGSPSAESALGFGAAAHPEGHLVATGAGDDRVRLMRLSPSGKLSSLHTFAAPSAALDFSPSGHLLATSGEEGVVGLWDVADPRHPVLRTTLNSPSPSLFPVLAFAADGRTLATGADDGTIQLWDLSDPLRPQQGDRLTGHTRSPDALAFSPDGRILASSAADGPPRADDANLRETTVRLWNVAGPHGSSAQASLPAGQLSGQPFAPDGRMVVTGRPGALWQVGGVPEPRRLATLPAFNRGGQSFSFSPDGRTLATGHPLGFWDVSDPSHPRRRDGPREVEAPQNVVYGPDGTLLAAATPLGPVRLWDVRDPDRPRALGALSGSGAGPSSYIGGVPVAFAADRDLVAAVRKDGGAVHLWDISRPDKPVRTGAITLRNAGAGALTTSTDGRTLFVGDTQGTVTSWDITDPRRPRSVGASQRHSGKLTHLAAHPTRDMLAGVDEYGAIRLWDVGDPAAPREVALLAAGGSHDTTGLAFSPDGGLIAVSTMNSTRLWHTDVDTILQRLCAESPRITESQWKQYLPDRPYDPPCA